MPSTFFTLLTLASINLSQAFPANILDSNLQILSAKNTTVVSTTRAVAGGLNSFSGSAWSKRGVGFDYWENGDRYTNAFNNGLQGNKVSWAYSWDSAPSPNWPNGGNYNRGLNFVPMLWCPGTQYPQHLAKWEANVAKMIDAGSRVLLSFNEPDMCDRGAGGICLTDPNLAASYYVMSVANARSNQDYQNKGVRFAAPAVTSSRDTQRLVGLPWLRAFLERCNVFKCKIDIIPIHWYGHANEARAFLDHINEAAATAGGRPLWITEFGFVGGSDDEKVNFLRQVLPQLDRDGRVERYAFHKASQGYMYNNDGSLNKVGHAYATI